MRVMQYDLGINLCSVFPFFFFFFKSYCIQREAMALFSLSFKGSVWSFKKLDVFRGLVPFGCSLSEF